MISQQNSTKTNFKAQPSKSSDRSNGVIQAFAANTHQGVVRNYNEDRVSIVLNILQPEKKSLYNKQQWPECNFFGIFDGHGGAKCAEFLRDNLHHYIINDDAFPLDVKKSIYNGFAKAELDYLNLVQSNVSSLQDINKSGSCAIVLLLVDNIAYIANVGDSRAILSRNSGNQLIWLSRDHRPSLQIERQRIEAAGGQIYQNLNNLRNIALAHQLLNQLQKNNRDFLLQQGFAQKKNESYSTDISRLAPLRVLPGRLNVSRTIGDIESKVSLFGGKPGVIISTPEVIALELSPNQDDFIFLGCDGIFDKITPKELSIFIYERIYQYFRKYNQKNQKQSSLHHHNLYASIAEDIIEECLKRRCFDNVTGIIVGLRKNPYLEERVQLQEKNIEEILYEDAQLKKVYI